MSFPSSTRARARYRKSHREAPATDGRHSRVYNINMNLTSKQEKFSLSVASGMSQIEAYRSAYNAENMLAATIYSRASELMADSKISGRVDALREPIIKKAQITLEKHLETLDALRIAAAADTQFSAAISAEVERGKASGLYAPKALSSTMTIVLSGKDLLA